MTPSPDACEKVLLVQAEFDGELDAAEAARLATHRAGCPICAAATADLERSRNLIRPELRNRMPADARARLLAHLRQAASPPTHALQPPAPWRRRWAPPVAGFGLGAACAAALLLTIWLPQAPGFKDQRLADQIVDAHIRSLQPGHLEDVPSTDQHTVKPWFDGRIDFAPPVKNLAADRFPLIGGRLDYASGRPVAALVYQRDKHLINLFVWPAAGNGEQSPETGQEHGYNFVRWRQGGMALWAVSDVEASQLREFTEDWRRSP